MRKSDWLIHSSAWQELLPKKNYWKKNLQSVEKLEIRWWQDGRKHIICDSFKSKNLLSMPFCKIILHYTKTNILTKQFFRSVCVWLQFANFLLPAVRTHTNWNYFRFSFRNFNFKARGNFWACKLFQCRTLPSSSDPPLTLMSKVRNVFTGLAFPRDVRYKKPNRRLDGRSKK